MGILSSLFKNKKSGNDSDSEYNPKSEKEIVKHIENLVANLSEVKKELSSIEKEEENTKLLYNNCKEEIDSLQAYAEKAVRYGNDGDAAKFLEQKFNEQQKLEKLEKMYESAKQNANKMRDIYNKLVFEINELRSRNEALKDKVALTKIQEKVNTYEFDKSTDLEQKITEDEINTSINYEQANIMSDINANDELEQTMKKYDLNQQIEEIKKKQGTN